MSAAFSTKIILQAKVKNSAYWNIVNSVVCQNSIALNINFNIERGFQSIKICRNCKFQGVWAELKINQCFFRQFWTKYSRQILQFTWKIPSREKHFRIFLKLANFSWGNLHIRSLLIIILFYFPCGDVPNVKMPPYILSSLLTL